MIDEREIAFIARERSIRPEKIGLASSLQGDRALAVI
jgi:hypothetical protein